MIKQEWGSPSLYKALQELKFGLGSQIASSPFALLQNSYTTCASFYESIQKMLGVKSYNLSVDDLADAIHYGLVGPTNAKGEPIDGTKTSNDCRFNATFTHEFASNMKDMKKYPILVIDEFNPVDFQNKHFPDSKDYGMDELRKDGKMGKAIDFFAALTGVAYQRGGFVVFVGTRYKSVAKALMTINFRQKAALSKCTLMDPHRDDLGAWAGFAWTDEAKKELLRVKFKKKFLAARAKQGIDLTVAQAQWDASAMEIIGRSEDIRSMCDAMQTEVFEEEAKVTTPVNAQLLGYETKKKNSGCLDCTIL